jgi:hypothetical protein
MKKFIRQLMLISIVLFSGLVSAHSRTVIHHTYAVRAHTQIRVPVRAPSRVYWVGHTRHCHGVLSNRQVPRYLRPRVIVRVRH